MKIRNLVAAAAVAFLGLAVSQLASAQDKAFEENMAKYLASDKGQDALIDAIQKSALRKQQQQMQQQLEAQMKNPVVVEYGNSPAKGPKDAKITIAEFSDFECPFCKRGHETMKKILEAYPNDVKIVFKHRPLPMHKNALSASKAAIAAGMQGKFYEMADALFANQQKLGDEFYTTQAKALGLNVDKFKKDMASEETAKIVKDDEAQAEKLGVGGTPGFFVNGVSIPGAQPFEQFKTIIDKLLTKK
ncbi:MAG: thioredoxin domain-containing protein [SAR324 cluster bacterium]|uniref:Thioredoxin domain-containing protein n=1 Tax=SAR324 cluster bacterium TaxID=2024889 RepID=A0A7X9FQR1_9DELT|nr:thioredoxin domain-containing protein [SAR324 cluster bacterium]